MSKKDIYEEFRPTLVYLKMVTLCSLTDVFSGQPMFRFGRNLMYPVVVYMGCLYVVITNAQKQHSFHVWYWTFSVSIREIGRMFTWTYADRQIPEILAKIYKFDMDIDKRHLHYRSKSGRFLPIYVMIYMCMFVCSIIEIRYIGISLENFYSVVYRYWTTLYPIIYLIFCDQLRIRFRANTQRLTSEVIQLLLTARPLQATSHVIELERLAHNRLCDLIKDVHEAFGPPIAFYVMTVFIEHLGRFYSLLHLMASNHTSQLEIKNNHFLALESLLFMAHTWTGMYLIAHHSDKLVKSSKNIIIHLRSIPLLRLHKNCANQVIIFMTQVQNTNSTIKISGLFTLDLSILPSLTMSLITYMVVVIQLSPVLKMLFVKLS